MEPALTIVQIVALSFTSYTILLKIMSESPASYPDQAIWGVTIAASLMLIGGIVSVIGLAVSVGEWIVPYAYLAIGISYMVCLYSLRWMSAAEQQEQETQEELVE